MKSLLQIIILLTLYPVISFAQQTPDKRYKPIILVSSYDHVKWGVEPADIQYDFTAYISSFDSDDDNDDDGFSDTWAIPEWVAFEIKKGDKKSNCKRPSPWLTDSTLSDNRVAPNDNTYKVSGTKAMNIVSTDYRYIRGHLCPFATAARISCDAAWNTCTVLNAVPQLQWQNNGIWKELEKNCTDWADIHDNIWVVCGPVFFDKDPSIWMGQKNEVRAAIPDALYKIVIRKIDSSTGVETISFIIPNVLPKDKELNEFVTSINQIESLTGLKFLTTLTNTQQTIEKAKHELPPLPNDYSSMTDSEKRKAKEQRKTAFHESNMILLESWSK